jgi:hypothetical protein
VSQNQPPSRRLPYIALALAGLTGLIFGLLVAVIALSLLIPNSDRSFWEPLIWATFLFETALVVLPLLLFRIGAARLFARAFAIGAAPGLVLALFLLVSAYL